MSDEFLQAARQEIGAEIQKMDEIINRSKNDKKVFENSVALKSCLHKIKGLAPMAGEGEMGEIAKVGDAVIKHMIETGNHVGASKVMERAIDEMKNIFHGLSCAGVSDFKKIVKENFPHMAGS